MPPADGSGPGGGKFRHPCTYTCAPSHATHAGTYGSAYPFTTLGGSGGSASVIDSGCKSCFCWLPCNRIVPTPGGGGGGVIVIKSDGAIDVDGWGRILVKGNQFFSTGGAGSGGAILLRSLERVTVQGTIDANGGGLQVVSGGPVSFASTRTARSPRSRIRGP